MSEFVWGFSSLLATSAMQGGGHKLDQKHGAWEGGVNPVPHVRIPPKVRVAHRMQHVRGG